MNEVSRIKHTHAGAFINHIAQTQAPSASNTSSICGSAPCSAARRRDPLCHMRVQARCTSQVHNAMVRHLLTTFKTPPSARTMHRMNRYDTCIPSRIIAMRPLHRSFFERRVRSIIISNRLTVDFIHEICALACDCLLAVSLKKGGGTI